MNLNLFAHEKRCLNFAPGAFLLEGFTLEQDLAILAQIESILSLAPLRQMSTPNGYSMSVAMSNCGKLGWVSDKSGYSYQNTDPLTGKIWPVMPDIFLDIAIKAAKKTGYENFLPDACLINCYIPGAKLSLHQDKDEQDLTAPIISLSFGLPATFLFGGTMRQNPTQKITLQHGDVIVFGGPSRMAYHGIAPLKKGNHPIVGEKRINLTFRKVL